MTQSTLSTNLSNINLSGQNLTQGNFIVSPNTIISVIWILIFFYCCLDQSTLNKSKTFLLPLVIMIILFNLSTMNVFYCTNTSNFFKNASLHFHQVVNIKWFASIIIHVIVIALLFFTKITTEHKSLVIPYSCYFICSLNINLLTNICVVFLFLELVTIITFWLLLESLESNQNFRLNMLLVFMWVGLVSAMLLITHIILSKNITSQSFFFYSNSTKVLLVMALGLKVGMLPFSFWLYQFYANLTIKQLIIYFSSVYHLNLLIFLNLGFVQTFSLVKYINNGFLIAIFCMLNLFCQIRILTTLISLQSILISLTNITAMLVCMCILL